jgi:hypothetical protein
MPGGVAGDQELLTPMPIPVRNATVRANDCGDWWSKEVLAPALDWRTVENAEPFLVFGAAPELPCPVCSTTMIPSMRAKVEFAHCDAHGLWLDRIARAEFDALGGWSRLLVSRRRS